MRDKTRTLTPAKAGLIYGKFTPSKTGSIIVEKAGGIKGRIPANRAERRRLRHGYS